MAAKIFPPEEANPLKTHEPKDPQPAADYRQWISFEGCCTPAPAPAVKSKLHGQRQADQEHSRALPAHSGTSRGSE